MPKQKSKTTKTKATSELNSVTGTSKMLAAIAFIIIPILFLMIGIRYGQQMTDIESCPMYEIFDR